MRARLQVLGVAVELDAPDALLAPIAFAYRRFRAAGPGPDPLRIVVAPGSLTVDGRRRPLVDGLDPRLQLYQALLAGLMHRIDSHLVLHAAALRCPDGGAMLLAAPSGHGKSSQTLALADRGLALLGDDYAPLDAAARTVAPYPRAIGVVPGGGARLPPRLARAAGRSAPELFGKRLVDAGVALGETSVAAAAAPLRRVVLLTSADGTRPPGATRIELAARDERGPTLERELAAVDGISIVATHAARPLHWLVFDLDPASGATAAIEPLLADDDVVFFEKRWTAPPSFDAEPDARAVPRRVAAEHLGRELLNRRPGGRLLARHGGRLASLFVELAAALREASCFELRVGRFEETTEALERIARGELDGGSEV